MELPLCVSKGDSWSPFSSTFPKGVKGQRLIPAPRAVRDTECENPLHHAQGVLLHRDKVSVDRSACLSVCRTQKALRTSKEGMWPASGL